MKGEILLISFAASFFMIVFIFVIWLTKDLLTAVFAYGGVSLIASALFLILQAPDVAITEASVGAGLTTGIFVYALRKIGTGEK